jgi:ATP-dependent DNA helicase RecG
MEPGRASYVCGPLLARVGGVTSHNVLTHPPVRRNPLLAEIFQHIGAVNRGGLGVDRMYRRLLSYGKLPPIYPEIDGAVEVILRNGTFDETMAKFVGKKAREGHGWRLEELIILHYLRRNDEISAKEASTILQRTQKEASETLSLMEGIFLERVGTGRGTYYQLGHEILSSLGDKEKYTRIKGLSEEQKLQLLKNYIETNRRITNEEARVVCGINRHQATRLIQKLLRKGLLELKGKGRGAYYEKR